MNRNALLRGLLILAISASVLRAEVRLHNLFTDDMVLQRGTSVPVWGWADDGEKVTVEFRGHTVSTVARHGKWKVTLPKLEAGTGGRMRVYGTKPGKDGRVSTIVLLNVVVGEVWLASGQSNMEMALRNCADATNAILNSANSYIRLYTVPKLKAGDPTNNVNARWVVCGPETVPGFSGVAYYFARDLQKALGVPVGIIHTSWGGSPAEVWMREEVLEKDPEYRRDILYKGDAQQIAFSRAYAQWENERAQAQRTGQPFTKRAPSEPWHPAELYNGMIANLVPYAVKGAIWYQGESNAGRAWQYRRLFADMIKNWRHDWNRDLTFLEVQLAPYDKSRHRSLEEITAMPVESDWAELREAQWLTTKTLDNTGMAVITDVGEKDDIHPRRKEPVGARLALLAREIAYHQPIFGQSPEFKSVEFQGSDAVLTFRNTGGGLEARGGELKGFAVAGPDHKFVWATARIDADEVVVNNPAVTQPVAVRYGWADYPVVNLFSKSGLPASPFRTDDWPGVTWPKPASPPPAER